LADLTDLLVNSREFLVCFKERKQKDLVPAERLKCTFARAHLL